MNKNKIKVLPIDRAEPKWDLAAPGIRCRADWVGCSVYEMLDGYGTTVIAHNKEEAIEAYEAASEDSK